MGSAITRATGFRKPLLCRMERAPKSVSLADRVEQTGHALTADDLAELLCVSRITIFKQAKAGRIPSFRVGTCVRFDPSAVARWLRTQ